MSIFRSPALICAILVSLVATSQAQSLRPGAKPIEVLKADKRNRVKIADESANGFAEKSDLEAMYDRMVVAAEKPLPAGRDFAGREALVKGILGEQTEYPPTFAAAALLADPEGGPVYLLGRIMEGWQIGYGQTNLVAAAEIFFAKWSPKGMEAFSQFEGQSPRTSEREKDLESLLQLMGVEDSAALEAGKPLLQGEPEALKAWLLEQSRDADFGGYEEVERDFKAYLRKKN